MAGILKMSEAAGLALHTMALLAGEPQRRFCSREITEVLGASANTLAKVLQQLRKAGLLRSVPGPRGGFVLARQPRDIDMLEVYEAIDGALRPAGCILSEGECRQETCILGKVVAEVHRRVRETFAHTNLEELAASMELAAPPTA